ncbi:hypothetical protein QE370_000457 [Aeromicrobium sp. SORGH_AS981]|uniref:phage tail tube protein n=1 Tax=Aeromicrobium sp. SORGH_AS_0981 TaxID=3041802 RepID=UPI00286395C1|nr:hypothetical protein [Aeromicrobium sp. SORGH_AS_0981]MDR6117273.1 hypothetical protein [Aeromicrobium sp. SORGH_AS_0981]
MTLTIPESAIAEGNVYGVYVPTLATDSAATLIAGINLSNFLMPDWDGATPNQNTGEDRRFSSRQTWAKFGRTSWEIAPLVYTYLPQQLGTPGHAANKVYEGLAPGNKGWLGLGYGILPTKTLAANDIFDFFPVECGVQGKQARGQDEFSPLTVTQRLIVTGPARLDRKLVA